MSCTMEKFQLFLRGSSLDSHKLLFFTEQQGLDKQNNLADELFLGYFTQERYIRDRNGKDHALAELAKISSNTTYIVSSAQCTTNHITVSFISSGDKTIGFLSSGHITAGSVNSGCITIDFLKSGCITINFIKSGRITTRTIQETCCWT